jgi:hypothetical protein
MEALTSEASSGGEAELVEFGEMDSDGDAAKESSVTQGTLVDAWKVGLLVEESIEGVGAPIRAVDASVATRGLWGLEHSLEESGWGNVSSLSSMMVLIRIFCWRLSRDD